MSGLLAALRLPPALTLRALDDLHSLAQALPDLLELGRRLDARGGDILELGERLESSVTALLQAGLRLDDRARELAELGGSLAEVGCTMHPDAVAVHERTAEAIAAVEELSAALPTLERAVGLATPLEGAVERLGRVVDRLPRGRRPPGEAPPSG